MLSTKDVKAIEEPLMEDGGKATAQFERMNGDEEEVGCVPLHLGWVCVYVCQCRLAFRYRVGGGWALPSRIYSMYYENFRVYSKSPCPGI